MTLLRRLFGVDKPVIAMLHLPAMPGRPQHDRAAGMEHLVETVERDLESLEAAGVYGFLFCK
jgi:predicted TIM-barrel enzyme